MTGAAAAAEGNTGAAASGAAAPGAPAGGPGAALSQLDVSAALYRPPGAPGGVPSPMNIALGGTPGATVAGFAVGPAIPVAGPAVPGTIVAVLPVAVGPAPTSASSPAGAGTPGPRGSLIDDRPTLAELERRYIALTLAECGGNKKRAAEKLGIDCRTLYRALERAGVPPDDTGDEPLDD